MVIRSPWRGPPCSEQAGAPFGAAKDIGDLHANAKGHGENDFKLIVREAFSSTLVNGQRGPGRPQRVACGSPIPPTTTSA
jgi:hypothetical protein